MTTVYIQKCDECGRLSEPDQDEGWVKVDIARINTYEAKAACSEQCAMVLAARALEELFTRPMLRAVSARRRSGS